jgi:hypothetical protein
MSEFDLDLRSAEEHLETDADDTDVVLGVLDGETDPEEWARAVAQGKVLLLSVDGDLNDLASGFARDVKDRGGSLVHFRSFLVVAPPGVGVDSGRLG